jgi:hypothetical protein
MMKFLSLLFLIVFAFAFVDRQIFLMRRETISDNTSLLQRKSDSESICTTKGADCYASMINDGICDAACSGRSCKNADREDCEED